MASTNVKNSSDGGGKATKILEFNQERTYALLYNNSDYTVYFGFKANTTAGSGANSGIPLKAGQSIALTDLANGQGNNMAVWAIHAEVDTTNAEVRAIELPTA